MLSPEGWVGFSLERDEEREESFRQKEQHVEVRKHLLCK